MKQGAAIGEKTLANIAVPLVAPRIHGHIDGYGRAENFITRNAAPETAVIGIAAIVAHHEIVIFRHGEWDSLERRKQFPRRRSYRRPGGVFFFQLLAVDPHEAIVNINRLARQANDTLDQIRLIGMTVRRTENNDLPALRISPEGNMPACKRNTGVITKAAHDQVVSH